MRHEFHQSTGLDSQLTGLLSSFLVVYFFFTISLSNFNHLVQILWFPFIQFSKQMLPKNPEVPISLHPNDLTADDCIIAKLP